MLVIEITPFLDTNKKEPLYVQLYSYFKNEIQKGNMKTGEKIPSKRNLARHLAISQHTVETAYEQLIAEGYVESKPRKGLYVNEILQDSLLIHQSKPNVWDRSNHVENDDEIDFSHGQIALEEFPYNVWKKIANATFSKEQDYLLINGDRQGEFSLREQIAHYLYQSRGVRCVPDQIVIGAGTQYLLGLLILILGRQSIFSIEDPGFHRTREVFYDQGVTTIPISLDEHGMNVEELNKSNASITYVTPSHQFPMGIVMPINRRMELIQWAKEKKAFIIEDDYDGEFRYKGRPIPALQGLDSSGRVIYLGTFSKSFFPSIRISYMVLPPSLLQIYHERYTIYKQTVSRLHQMTMFNFMKEGHWERHLHKMRTTYRRKQKKLLEMIHFFLCKDVVVIGADSGLHILLSVHNGMTENELINAAKTKKVKVYPTSIYFATQDPKDQPMVLLGFGGLSEPEMEKGVKLLKEAWNIG
ncbi:PLP-dependent aminotransferase family protein [Halalkalibacter wakoensis]|uniref:MocR-like pyridoxine biosynthesis transcription factor PdxR n=1 Tax=Halalkalibacter wakoensis TaxID=127891 RepID=UPI003F70DD7C